LAEICRENNVLTEQPKCSQTKACCTLKQCDIAGNKAISQESALLQIKENQFTRRSTAKFHETTCYKHVIDNVRAPVDNSYKNAQ